MRNIVRSDAYGLIFPNVSLSSDSRAAGKWNTAQGGAVFLEYRNAEWHAEILESSSWRPDDHWTQNLSSAPLCRENGLSTQVAASEFRHDE